MKKSPIEIPLSKLKLTLLLTGAAAFVVAGFLFAIEPANFGSRIFNNEQVIRIVGIVSMIFFGVCLVFILRQLFDDKIGLRIDETGITDNSSGVSVGHIDWNDITGIETFQVYLSKFIVLETDKPDKYLQRASNGITKQAMLANNKICGSPLTISSNSLKIKHQKLEELILEKWNEYGKTDALQQVLS
ncbi:STM3941 family protein [Mangrovivirga cuniculi]|uniref:Uncharacterized protein n=1 Tax=Mangrovivirga cuniculi TaxID=2715131 RepID=A0A4D7JKN7_9BACT|nr:STM3941 family protein [Mangrovivirga cuniculi]QCK16161.1 hypothetical protein DCC35_16135 [Mangrovivirga cuniculi]